MMPAQPQNPKPPSICTVFFDKRTCEPQNFSFPKPILDYIFLSSKEAYKKLIKTCKYFYASKPLFILCLHYNDKTVREWACSPFGRCYLYHLKINLEDIKAKIWLTHSLDVYGYVNGPSNILSSLIPKIYRSDIIQMEIANQIISVNEFLFLTPCVRQILFCGAIIKKRDGSVMSFEEIIENLPKLKDLIYFFLIDGSDISSETTQKLVNIDHLKNLTQIDLSGIPEAFDFEKFADFMNNNKQILYRLRFQSSVSQIYKNQLLNYLESIKGQKFNPSILFHETSENN